MASYTNLNKLLDNYYAINPSSERNVVQSLFYQFADLKINNDKTHFIVVCQKSMGSGDIINGINDPLYALVEPNQEILNNDSSLEHFIRENLEQNHHWVGSCSMGKTCNDGVVDSNGSVFGVENLTICDATIIPLLSDGNTSAPTYLLGQIIGEKIGSKN